MKNKFLNSAYNKFYGDNETKYKLDQLSRKEKLALIGRKQNKNRIIKRLKKSVITIYKDSTDISDLFCPKCGCSNFTHSGNKAEYPEIYAFSSCIRCHICVGMADNSPMNYYFDIDDEYSFIKREFGYFIASDIDSIFDIHKIGTYKSDWDFKTNKLKIKEKVDITLNSLFK